MKRPGVTRLLRISASAACLAAVAVVAILWVRNFWRADVAWAPLPGGWQVAMASADGQVELGIVPSTNRWGARTSRQDDLWGWQIYTASRNRALDVAVPWKTVIHYRIRNGGISVVLPHWLLAMVPLLLAVAPWIRWSRRFTIRTMMLITALAAVVLALAVTAGE